MRRSVRGAVLFETFVAILVLSIGVAGTLRVFGEALFAGKRNEEKKVAARGLEGRLFEWFADPRAVLLPDEGRMSVPLESGDERSYTLEIQARNVWRRPGESEAEKQIRLLRASQFYDVKGRVFNENGREVLDQDLIIYSARETVT